LQFKFNYVADYHFIICICIRQFKCYWIKKYQTFDDVMLLFLVPDPKVLKSQYIAGFTAGFKLDPKVSGPLEVTLLHF